MAKSLAIFYESDGYTTNGNRLLGRQAAGAGFLKGVIQHSSFPDLYCYTSALEKFKHFQETVKPWSQRQRNVQWLTTHHPPSLSQAGTLYLPGPGLSRSAWARRFSDQRAYSLCGVTHTICSMVAMSEIGDLLVAPVQPWDALICTSQAVKTAVDLLLDDWGNYLAARTGSKPPIEFQLPVIPLGIDCDFFASPQITVRARLRQNLDIPANDIVVLFVGRLCFYAKAHPVPMYIALEQAAKSTNAKIHLVQAGWFENAQEEAEFRQAPKQFCPSINTIFVDGRQPAVRSDIWACADIFVSLVDNIQETFGLTPIEAMAAGLPVIVSDWDGYKESVRNGIDGFKIPTAMSPPASSQQLSAEYFSEKITYGSYIAHTAAYSVVDVAAATAALIKLIEQPEMRSQMGENGRRRAREVYDWRVIINAYEELWQELAEIRNIACMSVPVAKNHPAHPLCDDPFRLFKHYPTHSINLQTVVAMGTMVSPEQISLVRQNWMSNFGFEKRLDPLTIDHIINIVRKQESMSLKDLIVLFPNYPPPVFIGAIANLVKFDIFCLSESG